MATAIGNLSLQIGANADPMARDISRAVKEAGADMQAQFSRLRVEAPKVAPRPAGVNVRQALGSVAGATLAGGPGGGIGASLGMLATTGGPLGMAAAAAAGLAGSVGAAASRIDDLAKTADRLNMSTEALAGLRHAANLAGVSSEVLSVGMNTLQRNIGMAATGGQEQQRAFERLGISYQALQSMGMDEQMATVADALRGVGDTSERAAIASRLFGEGGARMMNMLATGSSGLREAREEAERLGIAVSRVDAARVESLNDAVTRLTGVGQGFANTLTVALAAPIQSLVDLGTTIGSTVMPMIRGALDNARPVFDFLVSVVNEIKLGWQAMQPVVDEVVNIFREVGTAVAEAFGSGGGGSMVQTVGQIFRTVVVPAIKAMLPGLRGALRALTALITPVIRFAVMIADAALPAIAGLIEAAADLARMMARLPGGRAVFGGMADAADGAARRVREIHRAVRETTTAATQQQAATAVATPAADTREMVRVAQQLQQTLASQIQQFQSTIAGNAAGQMQQLGTAASTSMAPLLATLEQARARIRINTAAGMDTATLRATQATAQIQLAALMRQHQEQRGALALEQQRAAVLGHVASLQQQIDQARVAAGGAEPDAAARLEQMNAEQRRAAWTQFEDQRRRINDLGAAGNLTDAQRATLIAQANTAMNTQIDAANTLLNTERARVSTMATELARLREMAALRADAERTRQANVPPLVAFRNEIRELERQFESGFLDRRSFEAATSRAFERLPPIEISPARAPELALSGSSAAFRAIAAARRAQGGPEDQQARIRQVLEQAQRTHEAQLAQQREMVRQLRDRGVLAAAPP